MAWRVTATTFGSGRKAHNYDGTGSAYHMLTERYADQPSAERRAQALSLPDTRWNIVEIKEVTDG